jgi:uncharacterized protein (DUF2141 family)
MTTRWFLPFVVTIFLATPAPAGQSALRVVATNVKSDQGTIVVWVYDNADHWLSDRWRTQKAVAVPGNRTDDSVTLELDLPPGDYAFSVFQDLDDDGKLARNFIGIPKEPAGLSNNLRPKFGPPKFADAKFTIGDDPVEQRIALR